jgi:hypothetical protein
VPYPHALTLVYCTDEDIALRDQADYVNLAPKSQRTLHGLDGVFASGDLWTLTSASVNFVAAGLASGSVVGLSRPLATYTTPGGELFGVGVVTSGSVTLRRLGLGPGLGLPPSPIGGLTGVGFFCVTFGPQIDTASYDCNKTWGIDPNVPDRVPGLLYDPVELQQYVVLTVLRRCYVSATKAKAEDFALKLGLVTEELNELRSRLQVQWGPQGQGKPANSIWSGRTRR